MNKLETEVSLTGVEQAYRNADELISRFQTMEQTLNSVGTGRPVLENVIQNFIKANEQASTLITKLDKQIRFNVDTLQLDSMSRKALGLKSDINNVTKELAAVKIAASVTSDPKLLNDLTLKGKLLEAQLIKIDGRLESLARKRASQDALAQAGTGAGVNRIRGAGAVFSQLAPAGVSQEGLNAVLQASEYLKLSTAALGVMGALAVAGAVVVKVTQNIKEEAKKRLKIEEDLQIALNNQILAQKESVKLYEQQVKLADRNREFNESIKRQSIEELTRRKELLEVFIRTLRPQASDKDGLERVEQYKREALAINEQVAALQKKKELDQTSSFNNKFDNFKQSQDITKQIAEKEAARLKETNKELISLRDNTRDFILDVRGKENPLAKLMYDFETATERAEQRFKVFGKGFASQMANFEKANISEKIGRELFAIEQRAFNINLEIAKLNGVDSRTATKGSLQSALDRQLSEFNRTSNSTNPDVLRGFQRRQAEIDNFDSKQAERDLEARRLEIEKQVQLIQRSGLTGTGKTAEILNATQGLSGEELGDTLRKVRIDALKQSAIDDRKQKQNADETLTELKKFMTNFNKQLTEKGMKVDLSDQAVTSITLASKDLDATSEKKQKQEKQPSQADVKKQYEEYQSQI